MPKMGRIYMRNYGNTRIPRGEEYRMKRLEALAREEKKFNKTFGTKDMRYQNLLKKAKKPKAKRRESSIFGSGAFDFR